MAEGTEAPGGPGPAAAPLVAADALGRRAQAQRDLGDLLAAAGLVPASVYVHLHT
ncbi:hypothetical protein ABZ618_16505 [Streptomyces roseolus]|uniref:hypothetical protein n=1 Tax=Streptomyces roseolus TaxID=67358 RepID=UPI0033DB5D30